MMTVSHHVAESCKWEDCMHKLPEKCLTTVQNPSKPIKANQISKVSLLNFCWKPEGFGIVIFGSFTSELLLQNRGIRYIVIFGSFTSEFLLKKTEGFGIQSFLEVSLLNFCWKTEGFGIVIFGSFTSELLLKNRGIRYIVIFGSFTSELLLKFSPFISLCFMISNHIHFLLEALNVDA